MGFRNQKDMKNIEVDPVTFEVIQHKLWAIGDEQSMTLKSVSGSPVVTESSDFNNGIYLADGSIVLFGRQVLIHAGTMSRVLASVIRDCRETPGIEEEDMFLMNDPYKGAVHIPDVTVLAPYFYRGELVAWFGSCAHQLDMGGMEFSSWCPRATERYQEGLNIPPVKLVEKGKLRKDLLNMVLANSRLPFLVELDLRALIASNNVAKRRFTDIIGKYGWETVKAVMEGLLDLSENKLRKRLAELPDGIYRTQDFLDHDGFENKLYCVKLAMTKEKDSLVFDFTGTSPQAPTYINCTESVTIGSVLSAVLLIIAYDIPWNDGLLRPVKIVAPEGSLCNARSPAPVGSAPMAASWLVQTTTFAAMSRLAGCSDGYRRESQGMIQGAVPILNLRGLNQFGEPFGTMILDATGGAGAFSYKDGMDMLRRGSLVTMIANIEANENFAPMLYLYRRKLKDSGGPGMFRGGRAAGLAFTPHDTRALEALLLTHGVEVPNAGGIFGGFPGSCIVSTIVRDSDIGQRYREGRIPFKASELNGQRAFLEAKPGKFPIKPGDVFEYFYQGGGGYGSPLKREEQRVLKDVLDGSVSLECARNIYGVEVDIDSKSVVRDKTAMLRRQKSISQFQTDKTGRMPKADKSAGGRTVQIGPGLIIDKTGAVSCRCGQVLGAPGSNWREAASRKLLQPSEVGPLVKLHQDLEIRQYLCPSCGLIHSVDVEMKGHPPIWDIEISHSPFRQRQER